MPDLKNDIAAYEAIQADLEMNHLKEWVIIYEGEVRGFFPDFDAAATEAVAQFGRGPYLIRQVGSSSAPLPASVLFRSVGYAQSALRT